MKNKIFGTDGIRGPYGTEVMNEDLAYSLGFSIGKYLEEEGLNNASILLGRDPRESGESLQKACASGIHQFGHQTFDAGIVPTPALAFGVKSLGCKMGVMVTASHNPASDNGLKLFSSAGAKLSIDEESRIENLLRSDIEVQSDSVDMKFVEIREDYKTNLRSFFPGDVLKGKRIVLDTANGATSVTSPAVLAALGAEVISIHNGDGVINSFCGSEAPNSLQEKVMDMKADLGIAHDGDGDRVVFVDSSAKLIDGDKILGLLALLADKKNNLKQKGFVATVHSNSGLATSLSSIGIELHQAQVGDRNVANVMETTGCNWEGESSGHVVAHDYLATGDGLFTALCIASELGPGQASLQNLTAWVELWPCRSDSFMVKEKIPLENCSEIQNALEKVEGDLADNGRVLLRYSGTEPKIRLLVEAKNENLADEIFTHIMNIIQKTL